ncbi:zinc finger protein 70-like [Lineus longissimus]|uniref:zinc finger protein 70-like n=1 Tax=Lineus longissimus TaxID=88925 RepID=UPI00315D3BE9
MRSTRELEDELLSAALSSDGAIPVGATLTIDDAAVSSGKGVRPGTSASYGTTDIGTVPVVNVTFNSAGTMGATPAARPSNGPSTVKKTKWRRRKPEPKKFKCEYCEMAFSTSSGVIIHTRTHTGDKPFKCSMCSKAFAREDSLRNHVMIHTGEKPSKCSICGKSFREKKSLRYHLLTHKELIPAINRIVEEQSHEAGTINPIYKCRICQKVTRGMGKYKIHLIRHRELAPALHSIMNEQKTDRKIRATVPKKHIQCSLCLKIFEKNSLFKIHFRTHTGEKPFLCSVCGKSCTTDGSLSKHMQTHFGIESCKTKQCPYCDKAFRDVTGLREHQRIHTGEMPYTCHLCGKSFRFKSNLNAHLRIHRK